MPTLTVYTSPGFRIAQMDNSVNDRVDGTMIMENENETQQVSVDSEGKPVYAGTSYMIYGIAFVALLIAAIIVYKTSRKMQKQP